MYFIYIAAVNGNLSPYGERNSLTLVMWFRIVLVLSFRFYFRLSQSNCIRGLSTPLRKALCTISSRQASRVFSWRRVSLIETTTRVIVRIVPQTKTSPFITSVRWRRIGDWFEFGVDVFDIRYGPF